MECIDEVDPYDTDWTAHLPIRLCYILRNSGHLAVPSVHICMYLHCIIVTVFIQNTFNFLSFDVRAINTVNCTGNRFGCFWIPFAAFVSTGMALVGLAVFLVEIVSVCGPSFHCLFFSILRHSSRQFLSVCIDVARSRSRRARVCRR